MATEELELPKLMDQMKLPHRRKVGARPIAPAIKVVAAVFALGVITPGEGEAVARIVDTFARAIATSDFEPHLKGLEHAASEARDDRYAYAW
jgi:hypothetical protein